MGAGPGMASVEADDDVTTAGGECPPAPPISLSAKPVTTGCFLLESRSERLTDLGTIIGSQTVSAVTVVI